MIGDTFELMEDSDIEEEADEEVNKVLFEVTNGNKKIQILFISNLFLRTFHKKCKKNLLL
jgi:hypothetical protein